MRECDIQILSYQSHSDKQQSCISEGLVKKYRIELASRAGYRLLRAQGTYAGFFAAFATFAQRARCAAAIRARPAAEMVLFLEEVPFRDPGGRPRRAV